MVFEECVLLQKVFYQLQMMTVPVVGRNFHKLLKFLLRSGKDDF
jgi:hypothetical protein